MNSVESVLVLLEEEDDDLKGHALKKLHQNVDVYWAEISDYLAKIETISEMDSFKHRELAASVASICFYHLEEYEDALRLALAAGKLFDVNSLSEYSTTMVGKCIETYVEMRAAGDSEEKGEVDPRLEHIVEGMFARCYQTGNFRQALGIALEAQRLDKVKDTLVQSGQDLPALLSHTLEVCQQLVTVRKFRLEVLRVLVELYEAQETPNYVELAVCLHYLGDVESFGKLLTKLIRAGDPSYLIAFQVAFDLVELQDQRFVNRLHLLLAEQAPKQPQDDDDNDAMGDDADSAFATRFKALLSILHEGTATALQLDFLYRKNNTDPLILKNLKTTTETGRKNSVLHNATIVAHGYLNAGTTNDRFLRNNLDWLGKASNWAKFTATGSIGVVHKGNVKPSMQLLQPYLPNAEGGPSQSPYSEGGALYALGLIHACEGATNEVGSKALDYLKSALAMAATQESEVAREALEHGACLGVGLVAMSSGNAELIEQLRNILYQDNAVAGEAAAIAMGMVMLGGGAEYASEIEHLVGYAHDTTHEKIIRGIALCIAMVMYGQEEAADALIEQLCRDKDPILRYGGMYTIAMAYAGTANNAAIRRLLHVAVSDVNNDVRRVAVSSLGYLMLQTPEQLPDLIALLSESYNPHVRYGSALAIGIGCSGMADPTEALQLLEPLADDKVDFVRQGALLSSSMLLMQHNPEQNNKAKALRAKLTQITSDQKHASTMSRMGAMLSQGLLDAGGRNVTIDLISNTGITKAPAIVGMVLWTQYWYWYPMLHMISLTFSPTAIIGVNGDLDLPKDFRVECDEDLAAFAYPKPLTEKKEKAKVRVKVVELSTTAKAKAKSAKKKKEQGDAMEVVDENEPTNAGGESKDDDAEKKDEEDKEQIPEEDPLQNPLRVTRQQISHIKFGENERYVPVHADRAHKVGIVVLSNSKPGEPEDVIKVTVPPSAEDENEPAPPEPFEWTPPEAASSE